VCTKVADGTHDTPVYILEGVPLITSKNLKPSGIDFDNVKFLSQEEHEQISKRSGVQKGDLLIAMIGTIGNATMIEGDEVFSIKNVGLIRPNKEQVLGRYIYYFMHNSRIFDLFELRGGTQKFISLGSIRKMKICYPDLKTQEKIIKELDELRARVAELRALQNDQLADLKSLERAYLHEAFNGELA
jgi:type I restriction enzyme S subunit